MDHDTTSDLTWFQRRKLRRKTKHALREARILCAMKEGTWSEEKIATIHSLVAVLENARKSDDPDAIENALTDLSDRCEEFNPAPPWAFARDIFDTLVVALSVALAFRAYYYQPFKIPTGSMQPTLYGIHSVTDAPSTFWDTPILNIPAWLVTGSSYKEIRSKALGSSRVVNYRLQSDRKPGYGEVHMSTGHVYYIPSDAVYQFSHTVPLGTSFRQGDVIWKGRIYSGDFLFVNRWLWNFRHPRRGEVVVFSTRGIKGLPPATHYIKRMTGIPGDTISISPPNLLINGTPVLDPPRMGQIARQEKIADWAPNYAGFTLPDNWQKSDTHPDERIVSTKDALFLKPGHYYAMGDNSKNSYDSRYWGTVPAENLLGPASFVHWPFASPRWGKIE